MILVLHSLQSGVTIVVIGYFPTTAPFLVVRRGDNRDDGDTKVRSSYHLTHPHGPHRTRCPSALTLPSTTLCANAHAAPWLAITSCTSRLSPDPSPALCKREPMRLRSVTGTAGAAVPPDESLCRLGTAARLGYCTWTKSPRHAIARL